MSDQESLSSAGIRMAPYIVALSASILSEELVSQCKQALFDDWF